MSGVKLLYVAWCRYSFPEFAITIAYTSLVWQSLLPKIILPSVGLAITIACSYNEV
jgi:hypothetical protein